MERVKINIPNEKPCFSTEIPITINLLNYGNHMGNDRLLTLCHEARMRWLSSQGYSELNCWGASLILADAAMVFKTEGHYADQIKIEMFLGELSSHGYDLFYLLTNMTKGKELARVKTGMVFYDYEAKRLGAVPEGFKQYQQGFKV